MPRHSRPQLARGGGGGDGRPVLPRRRRLQLRRRQHRGLSLFKIHVIIIKHDTDDTNVCKNREGISLTSDVRSESPARDARVEARLHEHRVVLYLRRRAANTALKRNSERSICTILD